MDRVVSLEISGASIAVGDPPGHTILRSLDLRVAPGEFVVLFGTSGVGKSTLLRAVAGLLTPVAGGISLPSVKEAGRRQTGMVFQDARLFPWRTVRRNVALGLEGLRLPREERERRIDDALALVGLGEYGHRRPRALSGGQQQRVGIARALAVHPALLLMDEPFSALDAITRRALQDELRRIWQQTGSTVLFVTHDVEEAVLLADRIVLLAGSPATAVEEYRPGTERPRRLTDPEITALCNRIRADLYAYHSGDGL